jgi:hypothetical protein
VGPLARHRPTRFCDRSHQSDPPLLHQVGALATESGIGMVVRISDLAVTNPHDRCPLRFPERPLKDRSIDSVANVARRATRRHSPVASEDPGVGRSID